LWSGLENRNDELQFCWDFEMNAGGRERYRFMIPAEKIPEGVSKIRISYDEKYTGKFDGNKIELRVDGESVPREALDILNEEEANFIEIGIDLELLDELGKQNLRAALEQGHSLEVVCHNVKNPNFGGMFYFQGSFLPANNEVPVFLDIGTWIVSVNRR
jgi:hypothetical protein